MAKRRKPKDRNWIIEAESNVILTIYVNRKIDKKEISKFIDWDKTVNYIKPETGTKEIQGEWVERGSKWNCGRD